MILCYCIRHLAFPKTSTSMFVTFTLKLGIKLRQDAILQPMRFEIGIVSASDLATHLIAAPSRSPCTSSFAIFALSSRLQCRIRASSGYSLN
jgi:hypothetical protein